MIDFLKSWVTNIVILVILISFLEIILPTSNMKRYINMIIGLLVILVLINPFIALITNDMSIEKEVFSNILEANEMSRSNKENFSDVQDNQVIELYKDSLRKEMLDLINSKTKYMIANISIGIVENREDERFGEIEEVSLIVDNSPQDTGSNGNKNINIKVDNVKEVSVKVNKDSNTKNKNNSSEYNDLRRLISDSYRIPESKIYIIEN